MRILLSFFVVMFVVAGSGAASAEKRIALVIGNSDYRHVSKLVNPGNDARLIASVLKRLDFQLIGEEAHFDVDKQRLERLVQQFGRSIADADAALFYFAGHGIQVRGRNFLIPVEANPVREADIGIEMLDANLVLGQMEGSGSKLNMMILDACRNNPFGESGFRSASRGLAVMQAPQGTIISFATQPGNVALDGDTRNSPFSKALADALTRPGLDVFRTFNQVGVAVSKATNGEQQPWVSLSPITGDFYFSGRPEVPAADARQDEAMLKELEELRGKLASLQNSKEARPSGQAGQALSGAIGKPDQVLVIGPFVLADTSGGVTIREVVGTPPTVESRQRSGGPIRQVPIVAGDRLVGIELSKNLTIARLHEAVEELTARGKSHADVTILRKGNVYGARVVTLRLPIRGAVMK